MTFHAIIEYIKYSLRAKRLHGVHSPFVYSFSEDVLYTNAAVKKIHLPTLSISQKYIQLIARITEHYHCKEPFLLSSIAIDNNDLHNLAILTDSNPGTWVQLFNKHLKNLEPESVLIVPAIHTTKRHSIKWRRLRTHPAILLSIDLYGMGIIFFRKDFKEKQHFILRY